MHMIVYVYVSLYIILYYWCCFCVAEPNIPLKIIIWDPVRDVTCNQAVPSVPMSLASEHSRKAATSLSSSRVANFAAVAAARHRTQASSDGLRRSTMLFTAAA